MGKRILGAAGGVRYVDFYGKEGNRAKKKIGFWKGFKNEKKTGEVAASWKRGEG